MKHSHYIEHTFLYTSPSQKIKLSYILDSLHTNWNISGFLLF